MKRRAYTPEEDAFLLRHYRHLSQGEMARQLGRNVLSVKHRMGVHYRAGRAEAGQRAAHRPWTAAERAFLAENRAAPWATYATLSQALGRTESAVANELKDLPARPERLGMADVSTLLGYHRHYGLVHRWVKEGLLRGTKLPKGWMFYPADVIEFLQTYPDAYDRDRMPQRWRGKPNPFLPYARRHDPTAGYLTTKQAAHRLGLAQRSLLGLIRRGRLPATRLIGAGIKPHDLFLRREDVEALAARRALPNTRALVYQAVLERDLPLYGKIPVAEKEEIAAELGIGLRAVNAQLRAIREEGWPGVVGTVAVQVAVRPGNVLPQKQAKRAAAELGLTEQTVLSAYAALWPTEANRRAAG